MERVLLAVDGVKVSNSVLDYSLELCRRIKAGLSILHIVNDSRYIEMIEKQCTKMKRIGQYLETTHMAATFAEADDHDTARQYISKTIDEMNAVARQTADRGVSYQMSYRAGKSEMEIPRFVREHPDVIITIFDSPGQRSDTAVRLQFEKMKQRIDIPVVQIDKAKT
ncbi:MAG: universal stress protein [Desulfobacteraceae bacterium]|nr:MAG: universal stress protein [Desulfobacteraceae bacterium]